MTQHLASERFAAQELVNYTKANMCNHLFLKCLNDLHETSENLLNSASLEKLSDAFYKGRFLALRELTPLATDQTVENHIERLIFKYSADSNKVFANKRNTSDFSDLLPKLLNALANIFIVEGNDKSIRIHMHLVDLWQDLILVVPPLLITASWITQQLVDGKQWLSDVKSHGVIEQRFNNWLCDSTLPVDDSPFLDYICKTHGLDEVHMHLNGTLEADKVWMTAIQAPDTFLKPLLDDPLKDGGLRTPIGNGVARLLEQEEQGFTRQELLNRVKIASQQRTRLLYFSLYNNEYQKHLSYLPKIKFKNGRKSWRNFMDEYLFKQRKITKRIKKMASMRGKSKTAEEALYLAQIYKYFIDNGKDVRFGLWFWHYALIRSQFYRLLVQQKSQKGFDQFQYITFTELRTEAEKKYAERFRQIERGHQQFISHLEGRFAPKNNVEKTEKLLVDILRGYYRFLCEDENDNLPKDSFYTGHSICSLIDYIKAKESGELLINDNSDNKVCPLKTKRRLRLSLVCHFIKRLDINEEKRFFDGGYHPSCRKASVRRQIDQNGRALIQVLKKYPSLSYFIRGIDAASNERHAEPEIFAPVFRRLKTAGISRLTYHVGEDFNHIASGLRAMMETLIYLEPQAGSRLGHATASGLNVTQWWNAIGENIVMTYEDRLDDLIFAKYMIKKHAILLAKLPRINSEIHNLAQYIWQDNTITPENLIKAWLLRGLDPLAKDWSIRDIDPTRRQEAQRLAQAKLNDPLAYDLFWKRHGAGLRKPISRNTNNVPEHFDLYEKKQGSTVKKTVMQRTKSDIIITRNSDVLDEEVLKALQQAILLELKKRQIAIETLPSSNVRISIHDTYDSHHAQNWLKSVDDPTNEPVCFSIGSDDPGIFATSLRMEYAHFLRPLHNLSLKNLNDVRPDLLLEKICLDGKKFRF